jgi:diaminopimelate decarboxylase
MRIDFASLKNMEPNIPCYCFDESVFADNTAKLRASLGKNVSLVYSVKSNPFMIKAAVQNTDGIEICSVGELFHAECSAVDPSKIIFGGICKEYSDFQKTIEYGVRRFSIESISQLNTISNMANNCGASVSVLLRITSGNQFGMSVDDVKSCMRKSYPNVTILGYHYYPGTMRLNKKEVENDFYLFSGYLEELREFDVPEIEYGGGIGVNYYASSSPWVLADELALKLKSLAGKIKITYEVGRLLTYNTGIYITRIIDVKCIGSHCFVVVNGGRHHFTYHGGIAQLGKKKPGISAVQNTQSDKKMEYTIVGSLCNAGDILANDIEMPLLNAGDYIIFNNAGSYSITEGIAFFLSRDIPAVYNKENGDLLLLRERNKIDWLKTFYGEKN